jgi:hypothetical protein
MPTEWNVQVQASEKFSSSLAKISLLDTHARETDHRSNKGGGIKAAVLLCGAAGSPASAEVFCTVESIQNRWAEMRAGLELMSCFCLQDITAAYEYVSLNRTVAT